MKVIEATPDDLAQIFMVSHDVISESVKINAHPLSVLEGPLKK